jgi:hypothetical protein
MRPVTSQPANRKMYFHRGIFTVRTCQNLVTYTEVPILEKLWNVCCHYSACEVRDFWHVLGRGQRYYTSFTAQDHSMQQRVVLQKMLTALPLRTICRTWTSRSLWHCFQPWWVGLEHGVMLLAPLAWRWGYNCRCHFSPSFWAPLQFPLGFQCRWGGRQMDTNL